MPDGMALLVTIAGGVMVLLTFLGVTWKLLRFIFKVDKALPTLLNIASQFENNGGSTLKDKIDKIADRAEELGIENRLAVKIAEDSRVVANTNAAIVNELSNAQTDDIRHIKEYLHAKMHEINNSLTKTNLQASATEKRSMRIEERLDKLLPFVVRHREDYQSDE